MGLTIEYYIPGQTPIDEDEKEGLTIETITTVADLNEFEQKNIEQAILWYLSRSFKIGNVLTEEFIRNVHVRMYGEVWKWAGEFRKTNKNIGVDKCEISKALKGLLDDTKYCIGNEVFPPDEIAIRFKHRLVSIHCFPNGNGRHSRLMADLLAYKIFRQPLFSWGAGNLSVQSETRERYLKAIGAADQEDMALLMKFARS